MSHCAREVRDLITTGCREFTTDPERLSREAGLYVGKIQKPRRHHHPPQSRIMLQESRHRQAIRMWQEYSRIVPVPIFCPNLCIIPFMNRHAALQTLIRRRRPSRLSGWLTSKKIEEARRMTSEERLLLALELSDFCLELQLACSAKR